MRIQLERRLTWALGAICAGLMLATLGFRAGMGVDRIDEGEALLALEPALLRPLKQSQHGLPPYERYGEIAKRPLFTSNRQPAPDAPAAPAAPPAPPVALNVALSGVVTGRRGDVAIVIDKTNSKTLQMRVADPLPGEQGAWRLERISAREVVFDGGPQGKAVVKLDPAEGAAAAVPAPPPPAMPMAPSAAAPVTPVTTPNVAAGTPVSTMDPAAREAEIRRIIEERRAQMRAEAEKQNSPQ
jgi:hypothetical protein